MASTIWQAFLYPADGYCRTSNEENNGYFDVTHDPCEVLELDDGRTYGDLWEEAEDNTTFFALTSLGKFIVNGQLNYLFIVDAATGIFVLFVLLSYCIDTALRLVKLAVFQLIAPIPIFARILPNEQANKVFGNWIKATISTFIEVFIRIAILYFAVIIITSITRSIDDILFSSFKGSASFMVVGIAKVMIIVGIILFIKQAPQIIKDITGLDSGKYNVLGSAMRGLSSMGALTTGAVRGFTTGFDKNHMGSSIARGAKNALLGGAKSFSGAAQKDYKNISDIRKNSSAAVNDVIDKQRRKASDKLAKKQELEEYRNDMTQGEHEPDFIYKARSTKLGSRFGKMGHDVKEGVTDWATSGGLEALKQKRDQIAEVQKAAADVWSIANKEVKSSHEKFYAKDGTRLDELANSVAFYEAQMSNVKASDVLTNRYSELQEKLLNEKDVMQQSILRSQIKEVQDQIDADIEEKRKAANAKLIEYQEKLREGEKWATQFAIDVTAAGKTGDDQVEINGVMRNVEVIGGLSAAIKKADNLLKQNSAIIQEQNINLPTDGDVVITDQNGDKSERQRKYKDYRNVLGNAVDKLDGDISSYVEKKEKKENK